MKKFSLFFYFISIILLRKGKGDMYRGTWICMTENRSMSRLMERWEECPGRPRHCD